MLYKQHKYVGDSVIVGRNVFLPARAKATGRIVFTQKEAIEFTSRQFLKELKRYNRKLAKINLETFRYNVERGALKLDVCRTFGDINAWAGDHAKLHPPDGKTKRFEDLKVQLQMVANSHDFNYVSLALGNWDHFMPMSYRIWQRFHSSALRLARKYASNSKRGPAFKRGVDANGRTKTLIFNLQKSDLAKALFLEAYACHFLEDCFASGHLRTPRLLFGRDVDALRSKYMHDEDNELRLEGCNKKGERFRLIGEDEKRDDFTKPAKVKKDEDMKVLLGKVVDTVSSSVQQVFDVAYKVREQKEVKPKEIASKIPQIQIYWQELDEKRSRTHALEIWPKLDNSDTPKPLYKFHADYDKKKKSFKDPIVLRRTRKGSWRRVLLLDVDAFTPGNNLAWWIPSAPEQRKTIP